MSDKGIARPDDHGSQLATASAGLPERFENPGLPPHVHRAADDDLAAAKRAERQVAALFTLSIIGTIGFIVAYFAVHNDTTVFLPFFGTTYLLNLLLGLFMAIALLGIGFGAVHWAKTLMSDEEVIEERHPIRSDDATRAKALKIIGDGAESSQLSRRPIIKATMGTALGLFALPFLVQLAGSMGNPTKALEESKQTIWDVNGKHRKAADQGKPIRLMRDPELTPIRADEVSIGSVFHVMPETLKDSHHILEDKAKAAVLLMRLDPADFKDTEHGRKARDWGAQGIVAYSKICTHVGCPVGLYEHRTHHLLCPCHQSTFDVTNDCEVIFGPAKRPLPQLKIEIDAEGYLVAKQGFTEPVGPSYWERTW
ncbi:MAG TPA: Rieske 2Fe-2S domain-containing protein [Dermatophilaceae bacterium]|nr:Rieske 2Fe-2S domain-containing protein [Dermatophilaceae bacterium]